MNTLKVYSREDLARLTRIRSGEVKAGEVTDCVTGNWKDYLQKSTCKFVILGIAEDIGVRANYGRAGAATAFRPALDSFLNQQSNHFFDHSSVLVLGEVNVEDLMDASAGLDLKNKEEMARLRDLVSTVDERVTDLVKFIIGLGKIPVIIGGGHNNAYGNIKGASLALNKKVSVINCDPHLDFRELEGRHSGNGFSYAYEQGFLNKYVVCCAHEQYNNQAALSRFTSDPEHLFYNTYESAFIRAEKDFNTAVKDCIGFLKNEACGVEIDLDAITNVPTSAKTSSGISPVQARQYVYQCAAELNPLYFHIAEAAPVLSHIKADNKTGKLIAYLIFDFMKGCTQ